MTTTKAPDPYLCGCAGCKALLRLYGTDPELLMFYAKKLLVRGWRGRRRTSGRGAMARCSRGLKRLGTRCSMAPIYTLIYRWLRGTVPTCNLLRRKRLSRGQHYAPGNRVPSACPHETRVITPCLRARGQTGQNVSPQQIRHVYASTHSHDGRLYG